MNSRVCEGKMTDSQALRQKSHEIQSRFKKEGLCGGDMPCSDHRLASVSRRKRGRIYTAGE